MKKIVITGGHLTPALAVIEELQKQGGWEIYFFGREYAAEGDKTSSVEREVIPRMGIKFVLISAGRWQRRFTRYTIPAILRLPLGFFQALYHLVRLRPNVILSFGGYLGVPVVLAGWLLGIPSLTHEQTTIIGLGTKISALFCKKVALSWPQTLGVFPKEKEVLTGNPIRREIFKSSEKAWQSFSFEKGKPLILVAGGNQGSRVINAAVAGGLKKILANYNLFHQVGQLDLAGFRKLEQKNYRVAKFIEGIDWGTLLNKADLVISRAGINTLTELGSLGKPMLLIPIPWLFGNEQTQNAKMFQAAGVAEIISQDELTPGLLIKTIEKMMTNLNQYQKNAYGAKKLVVPGAAVKLVNLIHETLA